MIRAARSLISVVYHMIQALARPRILRYRQAEMQSFRVLVVDDFASFRECVCGMLRGTQFRVVGQAADGLDAVQKRSEEHTSELQSRGHLVCRLLLEKKKMTEKYLVTNLNESST